MNKLTLALCLSIVICAIGNSEAGPLMKRNEAAEEKNCKDICKLCSCVGFYCGDECICECNNKDVENVGCVEDMQNNCQKSNTPFEVLIQGPTGSRFVRSLLTDDSVAAKEIDPKNRSTVSIFKPDENKEVKAEESAPVETAEQNKDDESKDEKAKDDENAKKDEKTKRDVKQEDSENKKDSKSDAEKSKDDAKVDELPKEDKNAKDEEKPKGDEQSKTDEAKKDTAPEEAKKESASEEPKKDDETEKPKADEATTKPSESDKKLKRKRGADDDNSQVVINSQSQDNGASDATKSDASDAKTNSDGTTDPTVGLALPGLIPPLIGLKGINLGALKTQLALQKSVFTQAKLLPIHARIDALKARAGLGLAGLGLPLPIIPAPVIL